MPCTTILVGKKASYDGSTIIARNDDSGSGHYTSKKLAVIKPEEQPKIYKSVISHVEIELPENPMRYTAMPNAEEGEGIWAACGVNEAHVGMTATETITSNPRVLGADPLVRYQPAKDGKEEIPGGIGEEDIVYIVLPYIHSAREGVRRLGSLLEQYGTYEMNGIAFQDADEICPVYTNRTIRPLHGFISIRCIRIVWCALKMRRKHIFYIFDRHLFLRNHAPRDIIRKWCKVRVRSIPVHCTRIQAACHIPCSRCIVYMIRVIMTAKNISWIKCSIL